MSIQSIDDGGGGDDGDGSGEGGEDGGDKVKENNDGFGAKGNWKKIFAVRKFLSLANTQSQQAPAKQLIFNQYYIGKKIANGAFGQIRLGKHVDCDKVVAVKLEPQASKMPLLFMEYRFYKSLRLEKGFPKVYHFGSCGKYNALVMDLLGPNLEELFRACDRSFSISTILQIGIQLLMRIEMIHSKGIIYRDIKPENFVVGRYCDSKSNLIHVVDFGLAKEYIDPETGRHIAYEENKCLTGTIRYMSINAHQGKEQSRRDDMEAIGHILFYFLTGGNLPWQGTSCEDIRKKYQIIGHIKEETSTAKLGKNYPWEFTVFLKYCRSLKFSQTPDYKYLQNLFRGCLNRLGLKEDNVFDWMVPILEKPNKEEVGTVAIKTETQKTGTLSIPENNSPHLCVKNIHSIRKTSCNAILEDERDCSDEVVDKSSSKGHIWDRTSKSMPNSLQCFGNSTKEWIKNSENLPGVVPSSSPIPSVSSLSKRPSPSVSTSRNANRTSPIPCINIETIAAAENHDVIYSEINWSKTTSVKQSFQQKPNIFEKTCKIKMQKPIKKDQDVTFQICCPLLTFIKKRFN